jgi:hypothetical protein
MSLLFFSDQCVPAEITDILKQHHRVTLLREVLPIRSPDPGHISIFEWSRSDSAMVAVDFSPRKATPQKRRRRGTTIEFRVPVSCVAT